jgi:hypothetical protein
MDPLVELVFDRNCPNVPAAREGIRQALTRAGLPIEWREWERASAQTLDRLRGFGSPTVLVGGVDVVGELPGGAPCCRMYPAADGRLLGASSAEMVSLALRRAVGRADLAANNEEAVTSLPSPPTSPATS